MNIAVLRKVKLTYETFAPINITPEGALKGRLHRRFAFSKIGQS